jgi:hypothetical protein
MTDGCTEPRGKIHLKIALEVVDDGNENEQFVDGSEGIPALEAKAWGEHET